MDYEEKAREAIERGRNMISGTLEGDRLVSSVAAVLREAVEHGKQQECERWMLDARLTLEDMKRRRSLSAPAE